MSEQGIVLDKLLKGMKYVDLYAAPLAEPDRVHIFSDEKVAQTYVALSSKANRREFSISNPVTIAIGAAVMWDGKGWMIANDGEKHISLLAADGALVELPYAAFEALVKQGKITGLDEGLPAGLVPIY